MSVSNSLNDHHRDILHYMNEERKKKSLCDVRLVASGEVVHAHKSVLAAESEYFRTMFHSQFSDSDKNEIDLTLAVNNADDLEQIVNFIYTCQIEISDQNVLALSRLASFFLMKNLRLKIQDYILKKLNSDTCLQYYLLAKGTLPEVERMASLMLKAKFRDYLVNTDDTLDITPDDLKDFQVKGFLNFCETTQLLDFIAKWVGRHHTEKHIRVACHVITAFIESKSGTLRSLVTKKRGKNLFTVMLSNLKDAGLNPADNTAVAEFIDTFKKASAEEGGSATKRKIRSSNDSGKKRKSEPADNNQTEIVLVTLIKDDKEDDEDDHDDSDCSDDWDEDEDADKPFHVCVYVPSSQCWFSYCTVPVENVAFSTSSDYCFNQEVNDFLMFRDYIVTYSCSQQSLHIYNQKTRIETKMDLNKYGESLLDSFFTVHNDTLYMINRFSKESDWNGDDYDDEVHLIGYRLTDEMKFVMLFATGTMLVTVGMDTHCNPVRDVQFRVSSRTNEILIVHSTFDEDMDPSSFTTVFLVKLGPMFNYTVKVLLHTADEKKLLRKCQIVEMDDRFLIVRQDSDKTLVLCEYVFLSECISYDTGYIPGAPLNDNNDAHVYPKTLSLNGTHRFWQFEVYPRMLSILKSADFCEKKITVTEHMSPPLSKVLFFQEACLPVSCLKKLKQMPCL